MAIPVFWSIVLPGAGIPLLASWMAGDIKFGADRRIGEDSLRKLAVFTMAGIGAAAVTYYLTRPAVPGTAAGAVTTGYVPTQGAGNGNNIKLASPVSVNYASQPLKEFYSGTPPYSEGHIYVD